MIISRQFILMNNQKWWWCRTYLHVDKFFTYLLSHSMSIVPNKVQHCIMLVVKRPKFPWKKIPLCSSNLTHRVKANRCLLGHKNTWPGMALFYLVRHKIGLDLKRSNYYITLWTFALIAHNFINWKCPPFLVTSFQRKVMGLETSCAWHTTQHERTRNKTISYTATNSSSSRGHHTNFYDLGPWLGNVLSVCSTRFQYNSKLIRKFCCCLVFPTWCLHWSSGVDSMIGLPPGGAGQALNREVRPPCPPQTCSID